MKRLLILLCALLLTGCSVGGGGKGNASPSSLTDRPIAVIEGSTSPGKLEIMDTWGVSLAAKNVTPTGLTIVCTQTGGEGVAELHSGQYYVLEEYRGDNWHECEPVIENYGFTEEAWLIPQGSSVEWNVDMEWLYGELMPGTYRVGKEITNFRGPGDYDSAIYYAEFTI